MAKLIKPTCTESPETGRKVYGVEIQSVDPLNGRDFSLGELQSFVNGLIDIIDLPDGKIMIVNDEFLFNDSIYNHLATCCTEGNEPIFGSVLICDSEQVL